MAHFYFEIHHMREKTSPTIIEWEGRLTKERWKWMQEAISLIEWDGSNGTMNGYLYVDGVLDGVMTWHTRSDRYDQSVQYGALWYVRMLDAKTVKIRDMVTAC